MKESICVLDHEAGCSPEWSYLAGFQTGSIQPCPLQNPWFNTLVSAVRQHCEHDAFSTLPAPVEFWCLFLSQTAQRTIAFLFHISFLLGRQQIISCSLSKLVLIGLKGDPWATLTCLLHSKAPDTPLKRAVVLPCFPFPRHQAVHQFYPSLLLCCCTGSSLHRQPCFWQLPFQI